MAMRTVKSTIVPWPELAWISTHSKGIGSADTSGSAGGRADRRARGDRGAGRRRSVARRRAGRERRRHRSPAAGVEQLGPLGDGRSARHAELHHAGDPARCGAPDPDRPRRAAGARDAGGERPGRAPAGLRDEKLRRPVTGGVRLLRFHRLGLPRLRRHPHRRALPYLHAGREAGDVQRLPDQRGDAARGGEAGRRSHGCDRYRRTRRAAGHRRAARVDRSSPAPRSCPPISPRPKRGRA